MIAGRHLKIGVSVKPADRVKSVQTGCPDKVVVVFFFRPESDAKQVETSMHRLFSAHRKFGEWFDAGILQEAKDFLRSLPGDEVLEVEANLDHVPNAKRQRQRKTQAYRRKTRRRN
jgi:hypothetical protein